MICPNCKQELMIPDRGHGNALRRHKRGTNCRRDTEILSMNAKGFFTFGGRHTSKHSRWLIPFSKRGKWLEFFPETVVSFVRWKHGDTVPQFANNDLQTFLRQTIDEQQNTLAGLVLQHEYAKEDGLFGIPDDSTWEGAIINPPF